MAGGGDPSAYVNPRPLITTRDPNCEQVQIRDPRTNGPKGHAFPPPPIEGDFEGHT